DVVSAYHLLLTRGIAGQAYNVASGRSVSIARVVRQVGKFSSKPFKIEVEQSRVRSQEVARMCGSNRKLRRATGWKPVYNLESTLRDLFLHWKALLQTGAHCT